MSNPAFARLTKAAIILLVLMTGLGTSLRAQNATDAPALGQNATTPAVSEPAAPAEPVVTSAPEGGPRITPPLERYQPSLSRTESNDRPAVASGGNHTIVISTLALVLITIIVVLLVVD